MKRWWPVVAVVALVIGGLFFFTAWREQGGSAQPAAVGGPFHLVDTRGAPVDESILRGRWSIVYFGYTFCPDVCPTTLSALARTMDALGPDAAKVQVVFITVDPARDTPSQLRAYLANPAFPRGVIGLTGSPAAIAAAARAYRVYYRKAGDGPGYTVDHTSILYLINPQGRFDQPLPADDAPAKLAGQIRAAIAGT